MNEIERLREAILTRHPNVTFLVDPPANPDGIWHLTVRSSWVHAVLVEWSPTGAPYLFGVSTEPNPDPNSMWSADQWYATFDETLDEIDDLLITGRHTIPPFPALS